MLQIMNVNTMISKENAKDFKLTKKKKLLNMKECITRSFWNKAKLKQIKFGCPFVFTNENHTKKTWYFCTQERIALFFNFIAFKENFFFMWKMINISNLPSWDSLKCNEIVSLINLIWINIQFLAVIVHLIILFCFISFKKSAYFTFNLNFPFGAYSH